MNSPIARQLASPLIIGMTVLSTGACPAAEMDPVAVSAPDKRAWVGQRFPFFVELRGTGPFSGAAGFSLPQIPRTVIVKVGNPTVSSKEEGDTSWFIQTHEFALFSQAAGDLEIPPFEVRFSYKDGFTGPQVDRVEQVPALKLEIQQPPGRDDQSFIVSTKNLTVKETWNPPPGKTNPGAVFHRVITQQVDQMTGMALAPPPLNAAAGIRVYAEDPEVTDKTERGEFSGTRRDAITYVIQKPGTLTVPAIRYVWWNPDRKEYGSHTLPAVTFQVPAPPVASAPAQTAEHPSNWLLWAGVGLIPVILIAVCVRPLIRTARSGWNRWNPPDRVAARKLLRAAHHSDARAAHAAWQQWRNTRPPELTPLSRLAQEVMILERCFYGPDDPSAWRGTELAEAFRQELAHHAQASTPESDLPALNPLH